MKYKLLVVTVTYQSDIEELRLFIDSFNRYNDLGDQARLIVVDNSPNEFRSVESLLEEYPLVDYVANPSNPGFGASNNIGFRKYDSDYVLFVNNDVEFTQPLFVDIINYHESHLQVGCVGIHQDGGAPSFFRKMTAPYGCDMTVFNDKFHFVSGAFMFFKSDVFEKIGCFDESIFMYFEEFDTSERLIQANYTTHYLSNLTFLHKAKKHGRIVNDKIWIKAIPSFCHVCKKYDIDPIPHSKSLQNRLRKLQVYHLIRLDFSQIKKCQNIINARKRIIYQEFGIKI